ncbi:hypothetical protein L484_011555 [Morus notabilis]|uniref:Reverse transcriptase/retrotransposon-derived protein RNase H-like domain-containing protein n=1 Tax=Morus notabilis TaxID=981085 RepID=W9RD82_9ROSA|nr:hypothetical protein L484_011555 [Morus notabilis]
MELKHRLTSAPILIVPSSNEPYTVFTDASRNGLGCVLMQQGRVVAYASRQLKPHECYEDSNKACIFNIVATPTLKQLVKQGQWHDEELSEVWNQFQSGEQIEGWQISPEGFLLRKGKLVVPNDSDLRDAVLYEAHRSKFSIHPGARKCIWI